MKVVAWLATFVLLMMSAMTSFETFAAACGGIAAGVVLLFASQKVKLLTSDPDAKANWLPWFAWHPVPCEDHDNWHVTHWVWLETVVRFKLGRCPWAYRRL